MTAVIPEFSDTRTENTKKVWRYISVIPDHVEGQYVCIQMLDGDWGTPGVDGHDERGWREALEPRATRVILAQMDEDGAFRNIYSGKGKRQYP